MPTTGSSPRSTTIRSVGCSSTACREATSACSTSGCGTAEWLLRALATRPHLHAEGVDVSEVALTQARKTARALGVDERLVLHQQEAADFVSTERFDLVISVGATHAFDGLVPTLAAARKHLALGGRVLIGESFWDRDPSQAAVEMFGDLDDLATTVHRVVADGWTGSVRE